ncbi:MAG TPA: acyl-CoA dehydrogenase family protein [Rhizomicrobium sp.]|nr:acyl-CoA dehydrogenase family protein [Rhizomicrobium sp.]
MSAVLNMPKTQTSDILDRARAIVPRLREGQAESDRLARVPPALVAELEEAGFLSMTTPRAYGGLQSSLTKWMEVNAELGRGDGGVAWAVALVNTGNWTVASVFPRAVADEVFSTPNARVAGVFSPGKGSSVRLVDGGVIIEKGFWPFNSGVHLAHWNLLGILLPDENGKLTRPSLALMPISECKILNDWDTVGLRGSGSSSVTVENVFVPWERIVDTRACIAGDYKGGFQDQALYRCAFNPLDAIILKFVAVGLGQAMIDEILSQIPSRGILLTQYGKQAEAAVTHLQLGEASGRIEAGRLMVAQCCAEVDAWAEKGEFMPFAERAKTRLYTGMAGQLLWEGVDLLAGAGGGSFARSGNRLSRIWQDLRVANMHAMANPASNYELYGRILCGLTPSMAV